MEIFSTIVAGVLVFVVSQFILKIVLEPSIELKRTIGELANELLSQQAKITNNNDPCGTISSDLKKFSARLLSGTFVLPAYSFFNGIFNLPSKGRIREACQQINLIASNLQQEAGGNKREHCKENFDALRIIEERLGVSTIYS